MSDSALDQVVPPRHRLLRFIAIRIAYYPFAPALLNIPVTLLARWIPLADIFVNFQAFFLVAALCALAGAAAMRRWQFAAIAAALVALPALRIAPYYVPQTALASESSATLTVVSANLFGDNTSFDWFVRFANDTNPDIMLIQEYTVAAQEQLETALASWPYRYTYTEPDMLGQAIYSKYPLNDTETLWLSPLTFSTLTATIEWEGRPLTLVNVHTAPPGNRAASKSRNRELARLPEILPDDGLVVMGGDFNTTMWSPFFNGLLDASGLGEARRGHGVSPTWPVAFWPLMLPLDHVLVSPELSVRGFTLHRDQSDHAAITVRLSLAKDG